MRGVQTFRLGRKALATQTRRNAAEGVTVDDIVARIDAISGDDPEGAHGELDEILLDLAPAEVRAAALRLYRRCSWWACA